MSTKLALRMRSILIDYTQTVARNDQLGPGEVRPVVLGLFGEVGSLMATAKKLHREKRAFAMYREAATEEFGDALWYLLALFKRMGHDPIEAFSPMLTDDLDAPSNTSIPITPEEQTELDDGLLALGASAARLLEPNGAPALKRADLQDFVTAYLRAVRLARMSFIEIIRFNEKKTTSRFGELNFSNLPEFDKSLSVEERLPEHFEIAISQRASGRSYLQWHGVFIGDPLTDNIVGSDGYRFHDVFHLANAAILHWSPVMRALIKHKRKSQPLVDEAQDSGRPIVVEEGLTAWLFSQAKSIDYFDGQKGVSYDILKTISSFVKGYEVEACPLKLWERAILQGYSVFRKVRDNNGGIVIGDRIARTIEYRPLEKINA